MEWFIHHLSALTPTGAYARLAGILLLSGLGLPIPEELTLIAAGYISSAACQLPLHLYVHTACAICCTAVLAGDTASFLMGRWFGRRILSSPWASRYFTPRRQRRVRAYFRKFGNRVVFLGRFMPGLRFSIYFCGGTLHLKPSVFFIYDALAAAMSVPVLVYMAWFFGGQIDRVVTFARHTKLCNLFAFVIGVGVVLVRVYHKRRRRLMNDGDNGAAFL